MRDSELPDGGAEIPKTMLLCVYGLIQSYCVDHKKISIMDTSTPPGDFVYGVNRQW